MFLLYANKNQLTCRSREPLTSGSVNVCTVRFAFSPDWEGLRPTAVFKAGGEMRSVRLDESGECAIPWEVLQKPGLRLSAGVWGRQEGVDSDAVVLPTVWADLGYIFTGAVPGEESQPPTPELWEQALDRKGDSLSYDGLNLSLVSGEKRLSTVQIAGGGGDGGMIYQFGHGLRQDGLKVSVHTVDDFSGDNTLPMSAAGVQTSIGNIETLLGTI